MFNHAPFLFEQDQKYMISCTNRTLPKLNLTWSSGVFGRRISNIDVFGSDCVRTVVRVKKTRPAIVDSYDNIGNYVF